MPRSVVLYAAMSLDGFAARTDGSVDWLGDMSDVPGLSDAYEAFAAGVDDLIMGRKTHDQVLGFGDWPYAGKRVHVLTHRPAEPRDGVRFGAESAEVLVRRLRESDGRDIWLVGGPDVVAQFAAHDLIDTYHITIAPVILGSGIPLIPERTPEQTIELLGTKTYGSFVEHRYRRKRAE